MIKVFKNHTARLLARLAFVPIYQLDTENNFQNNSHASIPMVSNCLLELWNANDQGKDCLYGLL